MTVLSLPEPVADFLFTTAAKDAHPLSCNATILGIALFFFVLFHITYLTRWTEPKGAEWKDHPRAEWHNAIGSTIGALCTVLVMLPALPDVPKYTDLQCYFGYGVWQDLGARCFAGFLVHDSLNMLMYYNLKQQVGMVIHHCLFLTLVLYALSGSYFKLQSFWLLAGELSNVFLNLKIMMAAAGYKGTWYLVNGLVFTVVFGSVRVALYGVGLWHLWQTKYVWTSAVAPNLFPPIVALMHAGWALQLYWFYYTLRMLVRHSRRATDKGDKAE